MDVKTDSDQGIETVRSRWWYALSGLIIIALYATIPFLLALIPADPVDHLAENVRRIGQAVAPMVDSFWPVAGVVATIMVALAAATGFGRFTRDLDLHTRDLLLACALVGSFAAMIPAALSVVVSVTDPTRAGVSILMIGVARLLLMVSQLIRGRLSEQERRDAASRRHERARKAAPDILRSDRATWTVRLVRDAAFFAVPFLAWASASGLIVGANFPPPLYWQVWALALALYMGPAILQLAWRGSVDRSIASGARWAMRGATAVFGVLTTVSMTVPLVLSGSLAWLGIGLAVFTALLCAALFIPVFTRRIPLLRRIERSSNAAVLIEMRRRMGIETKAVTVGSSG